MFATRSPIRLRTLLCLLLLTAMLRLPSPVFALGTYGLEQTSETVGDTIDVTLEYTVNLAQQVWANGDTLSITLPSNVTPSDWASLGFDVEFDEDSTNDGVGETALLEEDIDDRGEYSISGDVLTIDWDETTWTGDNGDTLRISISSLVAQYQVGDAIDSSFVLEADTVAVDTVLNDYLELVIQAADAQATIELPSADFQDGADGTLDGTVELTLPVDLDEDDVVSIFLPDFLTTPGFARPGDYVTGTGNEFSCDYVLDGEAISLDCTVLPGKTVAAGLVSFDLVSAYYVYADTSDVENFYVVDEGDYEKVIAIDDSVPVTDVAATEALDASIDLSSPSEGSATEATLTITLPEVFPILDPDAFNYLYTISITFPSYLDVSGVEFESHTFVGIYGGVDDFTCDSLGQVVSCSLELVSDGQVLAGTGEIVLSGLVSTDAGTSNVTDLVITYEGDESQLAFYDTNVPLTDVVAVSHGSPSHGGGGGSGSTSSEGTGVEVTSTDPELPFSDLEEEDPYYEAVLYLYELGIVGGNPDGTILTENPINRAELMKILVEGVGLTPGDSYANCFLDVADEWFAPYVCYAAEQGWVDGYPDGTFKPEQTANIAEILKMIFNVNEVPVEALAEGEEWYTPYVEVAQELTLIEEGQDLSASSSRGYSFWVLAMILGL